VYDGVVTSEAHNISIKQNQTPALTAGTLADNRNHPALRAPLLEKEGSYV